MNWFLLLFILKLLNAAWTAPIDLQDTTTELLSVTNATDNLLENTTLPVSKTLKEDYRNISDGFPNVTPKVKQEEISSEATTEQISEVNTETEYTNLGLQIPHAKENVQIGTNFSTKNVSQKPQTSKGSDYINNDVPQTIEISTNLVLVSEINKSSEISTENKEISLTTESETEASTRFLTIEAIPSKAGSPEENLHQDMQNPNETLNGNSNEVTILPAMEPLPQFSTQETVLSNTESSMENFYQGLQNQSEKLIEHAANKEAEQNFTDFPKTLTQNSDSTFIGTGTETITFDTATSTMEKSKSDSLGNPTQLSRENEFTTNATPEQKTHASTDKDSFIVINFDATSNETQSVDITSTTEAASQKQKPKQQPDVNQIEIANSSNEGSYFKQSIDSLAEQLQDIGSDVSKTVEETLTREVEENSPNYPHISNDKSMEAEQSTEEPSFKPSPSFKETVDAFIADVIGIGSSLNLMNENKNKVKVIAGDEYSMEKKQENSNTQTKQNEVTATMTSSFAAATSAATESSTSEKPENILSSFPSNDNNHEIEQNFENLLGSASELFSNFGEPVESLRSGNVEQQETNGERNTTPQQESSSTQSSSMNTNLGSSGHIPVTILHEDSESLETAELKKLNQEIESASYSDNLISTTLSSEEVEYITNSSENSHQMQTVSSGQEVATISPIEVESVTHTSDFVPRRENANILTIKEVENITSYPELSSSNQDFQNNFNNTDPVNSNTETHVPHYEKIVPLAVVTSSTEEKIITNDKFIANTERPNPEEDKENLKLPLQTDNPSQLHHDSTFSDTQSQNFDNKSLESDPFFRTSQQNGFPDFSVNHKTPQEITSTNEPITSSTTEESTISATNIQEVSTNDYSKFEKQEENHVTNLENSQLERSTINPALKEEEEEEAITTSSTTATADETTILPQKFEEELQMAVKVLEQTTHQYFTEFQNNLKEAFKKFTVFSGIEHEKSAESATTQAPGTIEENTFSSSKQKEIGIVDETTDKSFSIVMEDSFKIEEPRSGAIHQEFVDSFDENLSTTQMPKENEQNFEVSASFTKLPKAKNEALTLANSIDSETKVPTTESSIVLATLTPTVENEEQQVQQTGDITTAYPEQTTFSTDIKEDLPSAVGEHNTTEAEETTTEVTIATTVSPMLATESLQEHVNHDVHNQLGDYNSEVVPTETQDIQTEQEQHQLEHRITEEGSKQASVEGNHRELTQTGQPMVEDITTTTIPETTTEQEMVKFVQHTDETLTTTEAAAKQSKNENTSSTLATSQTQLPLTQASFMQEQQQQIESTTANALHTHTAQDTITNETVIQTTTIAADPTEETIYSTTPNEDVQEVETTIPQELFKDTTILPIETVEAEARSLSLPPPKLEYLQNEDGVEVFFGYSIVKHN